MNYCQLQKILTPLKAQGLTKVKLNARETVLRTEYEQLLTVGAIFAGEDCQTSGSTLCSPNSAHSKWSASPVASNQKLFCCDEVIELDPETEALVAESWTDKPELTIATAAAYAVAVLATQFLWIALIATISVLSSLNCWRWCKQQIPNVSLRPKDFEFPFEYLRLTQPLIAR